MNVLLLVPSPMNIAGNQRFRFEHYTRLPNDAGIRFFHKPFFSDKAWGYLHLPGHTAQKIAGIITGFARRFFLLFSIFKYDQVFIHREAAPIGPPIFEWLIAKVFRKKIIYDFDDAIWVSVASAANPGAAFIKCSWKVASICRYSKTVCVGNDFLAAYAKQYCSDVWVIPTVVDTDKMHNRLKDQATLPLVIGWTGTYTNFYNLQPVMPVIAALQKKYNFTFLIIANKDPEFGGVQYSYKQWEAGTEIDDLMRLHIGLMPLENTVIEKGKCAFKAIQYMSLGIPAIVSPVGANCNVVDDNTNGYWAQTTQDWYEKLSTLIENSGLRTSMGRQARAHIIQQYSVLATRDAFFNLFKM